MGWCPHVNVRSFYRIENSLNKNRVELHGKLFGYKDSGSSVSMFEQTLFCIFPCDKELISTNQLIKPYKNSYTKSKSVSSSFSIQYLSNPASVDFHAEKS